MINFPLFESHFSLVSEVSRALFLVNSLDNQVYTEKLTYLVLEFCQVILPWFVFQLPVLMEVI